MRTFQEYLHENKKRLIDRQNEAMGAGAVAGMPSNLGTYQRVYPSPLVGKLRPKWNKKKKKRNKTFKRFVNEISISSVTGIDVSDPDNLLCIVETLQSEIPIALEEMEAKPNKRYEHEQVMQGFKEILATIQKFSMEKNLETLIELSS